MLTARLCPQRGARSLSAICSRAWNSAAGRAARTPAPPHVRALGRRAPPWGAESRAALPSSASSMSLCMRPRSNQASTGGSETRAARPEHRRSVPRGQQAARHVPARMTESDEPEIRSGVRHICANPTPCPPPGRGRPPGRRGCVRTFMFNHNADSDPATMQKGLSRAVTAEVALRPSGSSSRCHPRSGRGRANLLVWCGGGVTVRGDVTLTGLAADPMRD